MAIVESYERNHARWIVINRPERRNALNDEVIRGLREALAIAASDKSRAVVITGAGDKAFCAGGDLKSSDGSPLMSHDPSVPELDITQLLREMGRCTKPIIARLNGHALAGGFGLAMACDLAVACDDIRLGVPEVSVGVSPMMILSHMLRIMPARTLMEMCFTGEAISAADALRFGIVNRVVPRPELDATIDALVARISEVSPTGIRLCKHALNRMWDMTHEQRLDFAEAYLKLLLMTNDAREGIASFAEKRRPVWTGQ